MPKNKPFNWYGHGPAVWYSYRYKPGSTAAKADSLTFDDLIDLFYSLKAPYRQNAVFLMNDDTVKAIRKMKEKND